MKSNEHYIMERVSQHHQAAWDYVEKKGGYIIGTFLHGSQNYNLDTEESDVDTVSIYVPTVDFAIVNSPKNHQLIMEDGSNEHCTIKDIRNYINELLKSNPNAIELLYTKYSFYTTPLDYYNFKYFINNRENFLKYNLSSFFDAADGMAYNYLKRYDEKGVRNFYRISTMLNNISSNNINNPYLLTDEQREDIFYTARTAEKEYGDLGKFFSDMKDFLYNVYEKNFYPTLPDGFDGEAFQDEIKEYMIKLIKES